MSQVNAAPLECPECGRKNYRTRKNKKKFKEIKLELKKYCSLCHKHTLHKETK